MFTVKSIVIDIDDNWGDVTYVGLQRVELLDQNGVVIPLTSTDFTAYATSTYTTHTPDKIFDTSLSKIDANTSAWWSNSYQIISQRIVCIFNNEQNIYGLQVNNVCFSCENLGAKNIRIYLSTDDTQTLTYNAPLDNYIKIFDNILPIHIGAAIIDNFIVFYHSEYEIKLSNHGRQIGDTGNYPTTSGAFDTRINSTANGGALYVAPTGTQNYTTTGIIGQDFYRNVVIIQYKIYIISITNTANPNSWTFEGYDGSDWIVLDTQTNQYSLFTTGWNTYSINNSVGYKQYRMNITANGGHATQLHIIELEFVGYDSIYKIAGTTMIDSTPTPSTVRVYNNTTGDYICQQVSNASGVFNITGLPTEQAVNVVCIAPNSTYNNQIYRVTPVLI